MAPHTSSADAGVTGPLRGLKVLELGHFVAAPFCARLMADQGADVIKVEPPTGDPVRGWGMQAGGNSVLWSLHARNKRCVTLNLKSPGARPIMERLVAWADVVIENFRPGQMERWGLGFAELQAINRRVILARISGYGQTGPYRDCHAFGAVGEAMGGIRYMTGYPDGVTSLPPVRTGVSLADDVAALHALGGILAAVYERDVTGTGVGREIDIALYEAVFSLLEGVLPEYGAGGTVRTPQGSAMPTAVPSDTYRAADGAWVVVAGNSDLIFGRLCTLIGRPDMGADPTLATNAGRLLRRRDVDRAVGSWVATLPAAEAEAQLNAAGVPASRAYTVADCVEDRHFQARGMVNAVDDPLVGPTLHPGVIPGFDAGGAVGRIAWPGPAIGAHNAAVYGRELGFTPDDIAALQQQGVV